MSSLDWLDGDASSVTSDMSSESISNWLFSFRIENKNRTGNHFRIVSILPSIETAKGLNISIEWTFNSRLKSFDSQPSTSLLYVNCAPHTLPPTHVRRPTHMHRVRNTKRLLYIIWLRKYGRRLSCCQSSKPIWESFCVKLVPKIR